MAVTHVKIEKLKAQKKFFTPIATKVSYEVYQFGNNLYRSFSCDRIWTLNTKTDECDRPIKTKCSLGNKPVKRKLLADEPTSMARKRTKVVAAIVAPNSMFNNKFLQVMYWVGTAAILSYIGVQFYQEPPSSWNCSQLREALQNNMIAQDNFIRVFCNYMDYATFTGQSQVFLFTGGIGVGKTFATSIINDSFSFPKRRQIVTARSLPELDLTGLISKSEWTLLVVDDVQPTSAIHIIDIIKSFLNDTIRMGGKAIVIINFTSKSEEETSKLLKDASTLDAVHIPFEPLGRKAIKECFKRLIKMRNIAISDSDLKGLVDEQMNTVTVLGASSGCKLIETLLYRFENN